MKFLPALLTRFPPELEDFRECTCKIVKLTGSRTSITLCSTLYMYSLLRLVDGNANLILDVYWVAREGNVVSRCTPVTINLNYAALFITNLFGERVKFLNTGNTVNIYSWNTRG